MGTVRNEERHGNQGLDLDVFPASERRFGGLEAGDVVLVAAVSDGQLLSICRFVVDRVVERATARLMFGGAYEDMPYHALAKSPSPRMNLRSLADRRLSLAFRESDGRPLARQRSGATRLSGQGFRTPQWIDEASAGRVTQLALPRRAATVT